MSISWTCTVHDLEVMGSHLGVHSLCKSDLNPPKDYNYVLLAWHIELNFNGASSPLLYTECITLGNSTAVAHCDCIMDMSTALHES